MMSMRFFRKICFVATLLLFALPMVAATIDGGGKIEKKVWQDSNPKATANQKAVQQPKRAKEKIKQRGLER